MLHGTLATDGDPHLLLPANLAHAWRGHDESGDSQYDRACALIDDDRPYILIPFADTTALLINNADGLTALASTPDFPLLILLCREWGGHLEEDIRHAAESLCPEFLDPTPDRVPLHADEAILFGAAWPANEAPVRLRVPIHPATYTIATSAYARGSTSILTLALRPEP
ncbi:MAG: immunity 21 family protein [Phycisphaerales bacterium]|nr:hypothetical protein [Planctomycetota bacterium]MCH8507384.1 immunity 21 family protein [Phycisphaerales bacterium]